MSKNTTRSSIPTSPKNELRPSQILSLARAYVESGLCVIPIKIDGSKAPTLRSWKEYQSRRPNDGELRQWFGNGARPGVAIIGGAISGNLEMLDFDAPELIPEWRELVALAAPGLLEQLPQVQTPAGGLHVFYRCTEIAGNSKLAETPDRLTLIETKGEGGYVVTSGSPPACHPSGKTYELINGDLKAMPEITPAEREILLDCARSFNERIEAAPEPPQKGAPSSGLRPGDDFNERGDSRALLERHGWKYLRKGLRGELWARPGVSHTSGTRLPDGALYVFSSNATPFEPDRAYKPFSIYTLLEHGGDYQRAAQALAREGYGESSKRKSREKQKPEAASAPATANDQSPSVENARVNHAQVLKRILDCLQPCDFYELGKFQPQSPIKQKHYLVLCIRQLLDMVKKQKFALARKNDFIFVYNGEYWREIDRDKLKDFLGEAAERLGVNDLEAQFHEFKDKLYKQFRAAASFDEVEADRNKALINLKNGTYEITADNQNLREFRAEDFLHHQLPFKYDKTATAPRFDQYMNRVLPARELRDIIAEFFGYVFTRNLKLEKALLLYGSGANGKSVLFDVMNALLGRDNTTNYSLSDLMQEHNRAQIANKLLNYGSEINASITKDVFKTLVSGEPIMARLKFGNSFLMESYAKLCFNCNELPKDIEHSDAYFRRLLIVPFDVTIPEDEQDKELAQKIIAEELSGVFNWVLAGLQRLLQQKQFTKSEIVDRAIKSYRTESDSVACYLAELDRELNGLLKDIYSDYRGYCVDSGMKALGKINFRKRLEAHGYEVEKDEPGLKVFKPE